MSSFPIHQHINYSSTPQMPEQLSEEERSQQGGGAGAALAAYLLGAATVGIALLTRALQKKMRRRKRVVSVVRQVFLACSPRDLFLLFLNVKCTVMAIAMLALLLRCAPPLPLLSAQPPCPEFVRSGWRASSALPVVPFSWKATGAYSRQTHDSAHV